MRRLHLIEIHDQAWLPGSLRDAVTDTLQSIFSAANLYAPVVPRLRQTLELAATNQIVDLCSGAGGPWLWMVRVFAEKENYPVEVCLTDKYPNRGAFQRARKLTGSGLQYFAEPVDVMNIPPELQRFRTIFTSFHHFPPEEAKAILQQAVDHRQGIGVFEVPQRRFWTMFLCLLIALFALLIVPFIRPFRGSRLVWTYLVPLVPVVLLFDGIVSCLRAYSLPELFELTRGLSASGYNWEIGEEKTRFLHLSITYLIGYPS